jgi:ligand-binding sensor domain-containing protein
MMPIPSRQLTIYAAQLRKFWARSDLPCRKRAETSLHMKSSIRLPGNEISIVSFLTFVQNQGLMRRLRRLALHQLLLFGNVVLLLLGSFCPVSAQQPAYFKLGAEQFEGVQIYDMIQDLESNYWFATDEGLVKHDGYRFEQVSCKEMAGQSVFGFVMNAKGIIFCHTLNHQIIKIERGVCDVFYEFLEDERSADIHLFTTPDNALLAVAKKALLFGSDGSLYRAPGRYYFGAPFRTPSGRIISHLSGQDSLLEVVDGSIRHVPMQNLGGKLPTVLGFFQIDGKCYAVQSAPKICYSFDEVHDRLAPLAAQPFVSSAEHLRYYNENNQLWVAGPAGGVRAWSKPSQATLTDTLFRDELISNVFQDHEGNLLLSTFNNGVIVVPDVDLMDVVQPPSGHRVVGLRQDDRLGILLGTTNGQLLSVKGNKFTVLSDAGMKPLESIHAWPKHPLVIFDDGQVKAYNKSTQAVEVLISTSLKDAAVLNEKTLYLATNIGLVKLEWDGGRQFQSTYLKSLALRCYAVEVEPTTGACYIATSDGLKCLFPDGRLVDVTYHGDRIFALDLAYQSGLIYASTQTHGLLSLMEGSVFEHYQPTIAGQPLRLSRIAFHDGKLYATSSAGFVGFGANGRATNLLNQGNGFNTKKVINFAFDRDWLWLAHSKGVQKVLFDAQTQQYDPPTVSLHSLVVNDSMEVHLPTAGKFNSSQRKFRFEFHSPTLRHRDNIVYHYTLRGYEDTWSTAPYRDNTVTYNALGPGSYVFLVKAENQGKFSEIAAYSFSISAPFYSKWWFIVLAGLSMLLAVTLIYRRQLNAQRRKANILNELNASKLTAIQSQMNPHFIFNALNSIQDLVLKGDVENSYSYITTFSNLVRSTLDYSDKDFIDFEQEIKLLELYLALEKLRFKQALTYKIDYDDLEDDFQVPPLLVQPFVENALVHGLLHKEGEKRLTIRFVIAPDKPEVLVCTVEDNGVGRARAKAIQERQRSDHESFSGKAIRNRFDILSDVFQGEFGYLYEDLMQDGKSTGTRVTLHIPVRRRF